MKDTMKYKQACEILLKENEQLINIINQYEEMLYKACVALNQTGMAYGFETLPIPRFIRFFPTDKQAEAHHRSVNIDADKMRDQNENVRRSFRTPIRVEGPTGMPLLGVDPETGDIYVCPEE